MRFCAQSVGFGLGVRLGEPGRRGGADRARIRAQSVGDHRSPSPSGKGQRRGGGAALPNTRPRLSSLRLVAQCLGKLLFFGFGKPHNYGAERLRPRAQKPVFALEGRGAEELLRLHRANVLPLAPLTNRDCNASPYRFDLESRARALA